MKTLTTFILFAIGTAVFSQDKLDGFRGWNWNIGYASIQDQLLKTDSQLSGYKAYQRKGDCTTFEGLKANRICYLFKKDLFKAIHVCLNSNDFDLAIEIFTEKYGPPIKKDIKTISSYEWNLQNADIVIITDLNTIKTDGFKLQIVSK